MELQQDMIAEFIESIDNGMERPARIAVIAAFLDSYFEIYGRHPQPDDIERLADACLWEELRDKDEYKVTRNEYPFLSDRQIKYRDRRLASGMQVELLGSDRKDHRPPFRKPRTDYENEAIERERKKKKRREG